ncbi:Transmembrane protein 41A-A [Bagarius yarrelli]|uniref:Transmembrane protein 41A-A n=1 Tax=Bagarius yarrelli TaxID=175774 RepID=A0A556V1F2_BAGYA|nr:Transmembrane protein 41A-A [Bagarius yarrelli]
MGNVGLVQTRGLPRRRHDAMTSGSKTLKFPSDLQELKQTAGLLRFYNMEHSGFVLLLFSSAYLYKQAFAIPGSSLLNILAGALFGPWLGLALCSVLTTVGASMCLMPYNLVCVQTGVVLSDVSSLDDVLSWGVLLKLLLIACTALLPSTIIRRYKHKTHTQHKDR